MAEKIKLDVRMTEKEDDTKFRATVKARVSDPSGTPLPEATIQVSGDSYEKTKNARDHGMSQSFENVPLPATVVIEATGFEQEVIELTEDDAGSSKSIGYQVMDSTHIATVEDVADATGQSVESVARDWHTLSSGQ